MGQRLRNTLRPESYSHIEQRGFIAEVERSPIFSALICYVPGKLSR